MEGKKTVPNEHYVEDPLIRCLKAFTGTAFVWLFFGTLFMSLNPRSTLNLLEIIKEVVGSVWSDLGVLFLLLFFTIFSECSEKEKGIAPKGNLNLVVSHKLSVDEALRRVQSLLSEVKREHADKITSLKEEWKDNTANFTLVAMGYTISGTVIVGTEQVEVDGDLPFPASIASGKISAIIRERANKLLV